MHFLKLIFSNMKLSNSFLIWGVFSYFILVWFYYIKIREHSFILFPKDLLGLFLSSGFLWSFTLRMSLVETQLSFFFFLLFFPPPCPAASAIVQCLGSCLSNTSRALGKSSSEWNALASAMTVPSEWIAKPCCWTRGAGEASDPSLAFVGYGEQFTAKGWSHRIFWRKNQSNHVQHEADGRKVIPSLAATPWNVGAFSEPEDWLGVSPRRADRLAGCPPARGLYSLQSSQGSRAFQGADIIVIFRHQVRSGSEQNLKIDPQIWATGFLQKCKGI